MLIAQPAQSFQEAGLRRNHTHVGSHRFHDHRRHLSGIGLQQYFHAAQIIIACRQRIPGNFRGNTCRIRCAAGQCAGTGFHQHGIRMAVIAAGEFDNFAAARCAPGKTQGRHNRFRAGVDHTHHLDAGHVTHQLCHIHLCRRRRAEAQALADGFTHGLLHRFTAVAQNQRPPGANEVNVFLAVHVPDVAAKAPIQESGVGAHTAAGPHRRIHTAGHDLLGFFKQLFRTCHQPSSPCFIACASSLA